VTISQARRGDSARAQHRRCRLPVVPHGVQSPPDRPAVTVEDLK
jgi:hypothetical protein